MGGNLITGHSYGLNHIKKVIDLAIKHGVTQSFWMTPGSKRRGCPGARAQKIGPPNKWHMFGGPLNCYEKRSSVCEMGKFFYSSYSDMC